MGRIAIVPSARMGGHLSLLEATRALRGESFPSSARAFFAPGRANLLGAHLDYNGGTVMPVALSKGTCAILAPRSDRRLRFRSANFPGEDVELSLDDLRPGRTEAWSAYLEGAIFLACEQWGEVPGLDIYIDADLPMARGLSSSASVQCVSLYGLAHLLNQTIDAQDLIALAHRAEREYVGVQCGVLDPMAIFLGQPDRIMQYDCYAQSVEYLPMPADQVAVAIMDSGVKRQLAGSAFNDRVQECASSYEILRKHIPGLACLAHLEREQFEKHSYLLSEVQQKRTEHVVSEVARTKQASAGLRAGRLDAFGAAMTEAHNSLRRLYEVSVPELDALVEAAIAVDGCYGSRLTGAGFGGCSVAILNPGAIEDFAAEVPRRYREATGCDTEVMIFRPAGGPVEWALD